MSRTQQVKRREAEKPTQRPAPPMDGEESDSEELDSELEKDETEKELERLVFGDVEGFKESLKDFQLEDEDDAGDVGLRDTTGLEGLDDAALFFTDVGPSPGAKQITSTSSDDDAEELTQSRHPAAWEDSDDERMMISLASVPRLRKLRRTEAEDVVNGREYSRRMRRQFEVLNPRPEWAQRAREMPARKRRRLSATGDASPEGTEREEADDNLDVDADLPSAPPLSALLRNASSLIRTTDHGSGKSHKMRPETVAIQRAKDVPGLQPSAITSLSFHPSYPLLLSSGPSSTLYLHQIAPSPPAPSANPLLTSMHIRGTPLTTTSFHPTDARIFLSARRRYFHVWDLASGKVEKITQVYGQQHEQRSMERFKISPDGTHVALLGSARKGGGVINILSASTLQWTALIRVESRGGIADFAWWRDSKGLCIAAKSGEVTEWSVQDQRVVARWQDEGAVGTTTLALGGQHAFAKSSIGADRWLAIGSSSGIVNIYDRRSWLVSPPASTEQPIPIAPKPHKTLDHLTTPTSHLVFAPDGQILAMASKWKRDAMRLVHLPSATVYKNWPTSSTPLGRITAVAFADGEIVGGDTHSVLAVANEQGKIRMWEIR